METSKSIEMGTLSKFPTIFGIVGIVGCFSCGPIATIIHEECTTVKPYQFFVPVSTVSTNKILQKGDTIFINFEFSSKMKDEADGKVYDLKDFKDFLPAVRLYRVEENVKDPYFFEFSDTCCMYVQNMFVDHYLPDKARRKDAWIGFDFLYDPKSDLFRGSLAFKMQKKGIYYFKISSENRDISGPFPGKCGTRLVYIDFRQQSDGNYELVKNYIYPNGIPFYIDTVGKDTFNKEGGYAFEVR